MLAVSANACCTAVKKQLEAGGTLSRCHIHSHPLSPVVNNLHTHGLNTTRSLLPHEARCWLQLENEYGFIGDAHDKQYMRHLVKLARKALGDEIVLFTTDPPPNVEKGSLPDDEIFRQVTVHARRFS